MFFVYELAKQQQIIIDHRRRWRRPTWRVLLILVLISYLGFRLL